MSGIEPSSFGQRLRQLRQRAGLTQEELAARAGLSADAIGALERGARRRPYPHTVRVLAEALALSTAERAELIAAASPAGDAPLAPAPRASNGQMPAPATPLIGREREERTIADLLQRRDVRLLTLTGPGGVGKTRLAIAVCAGLGDGYDGSSFVDLSAVGDAALVPSAIAHARGLREQGLRGPLESVVASLAGQRWLLLLDNFEHVAAAAPHVATLLARCPRLTLLVTSRAVLRVRGEHELAVLPFVVPEVTPTTPPAELLRYPAIRLFVARAQAVDPSFVVDKANGATIAAICHRVDGLPLAIELAAARTRILPPETLLARLDDRLGFLTEGPLDAPPRQRTLRDAIAWSYDLLDPAEQRLLRWLAVFPGGCSLEAAESIARSLGRLEPLNGLESLARNSLVRRVGAEEPRFTMLETIREFAWDQLTAAAETTAVRRAHAAYFLDLAETTAPRLRGPEQGPWLDRLDGEIDNLREAIRFCHDHGEIERGLRLASALQWFLWDRGYVREGQEWLTSLLALADASIPTSVRARAMNAASYFASDRGDYAEAIALAERGLALFRETGDREGIAWSLAFLAAAQYRGGDAVSARIQAEQSLEIFRQLGDPYGTVFATSYAGWAALGLGHDETAHALLADGVEISRQLGDRNDLSRCLLGLGFLLIYYRGDAVAADACFRESFAVSIELGQPPIYSLEGLASVAVVRGQPARALRLAGAAAALREAHDAARFPLLRAEYERGMAAAWERVGEEAGHAAWREGRAMTPEQLAAYAVSEDD
jgi:predicted ATPase/DNA-binding XRE family transcriptional regulator